MRKVYEIKFNEPVYGYEATIYVAADSVEEAIASYIKVEMTSRKVHSGNVQRAKYADFGSDVWRRAAHSVKLHCQLIEDVWTRQGALNEIRVLADKFYDDKA